MVGVVYVTGQGLYYDTFVVKDPRHTVTSPKRLLGRKFEDREIQSFLSTAAYSTKAGPDGSVLIEMGRTKVICAWWLAEGGAEDAYREFCPNAGRFIELRRYRP